MPFLDTQNLPTDLKINIEIVDAFYPGEILYLVTNAHEAIFIRKEIYLSTGYRKEDEPGYSLKQFTIPFNSLPWLVNIIENKFWKKSSQGGAPANVLQYKNIVEGEELNIRFTPNCQKEFEPGITIKNYSRPQGRLKYSYIAIPYYTLRDKKLLQAMKMIK